MSGVIIIAASGMCEAGRIRHHLAHNLHRRDSTILFVGFQAQGSLGRVILEGARQVKISGTDVNVRAHIRRLDSYSAHADQAELLDWIKERKPISGSLFLTHGEPGAISALTELASEDDPSLSIVTPNIGGKLPTAVRHPREADRHRPHRCCATDRARLAERLRRLRGEPQASTCPDPGSGEPPEGRRGYAQSSGTVRNVMTFSSTAPSRSGNDGGGLDDPRNPEETS